MGTVVVDLDQGGSVKALTEKERDVLLILVFDYQKLSREYPPEHLDFPSFDFIEIIRRGEIPVCAMKIEKLLGSIV